MIGKPLQIIQFLYNEDKDKVFEIKEHKDKRSLDANAYAWHLIVQISNIMRKSKEEVYLSMLKDYGQSAIFKIKNNVPIEKFAKYYEKVNEIDDCTYYKIYAGSSEYDTKEFSIFVDGVIEEAKQLGIETLTPNELSRLKEEICQ